MSDLALLLLITLSPSLSFRFKVASVVYIYKDPKVAAFLFSLDQFHSLEDMGTLEQIDAPQTQSSSSSSSSIDSNNHPSRTRPPSSPSSSVCRNRTDLSTDLRLGLSISPSSQSESAFNSTPSYLPFREETFDWPPIKSILRSTLVGKQSHLSQRPSLFVKVYMEGIPIGRKLNLLAHCSYDGLVKTLGHMFRTTILCPNSQPLNPGNFHVLTYEDQEGDWMMVGDVPWEMFLNSVKRMKITRADRC
ncbi:Auxin-responsive protein IAA31 [Spatholobus suberectus]|nr:Auxin-responsive protein IAA31 [Spatholobus suberectus]